MVIALRGETLDLKSGVLVTRISVLRVEAWDLAYSFLLVRMHGEVVLYESENRPSSDPKSVFNLGLSSLLDSWE
jgi:hypothetical protein